MSANTNLSRAFIIVLSVAFYLAGIFSVSGQNENGNGVGPGNGQNDPNVPTLWVDLIPSDICYGTDIDIRVTIKNGTGNKYFDTDSVPYNYTIYIEGINNTLNDSIKFSSSIIPSPSNGATAEITVPLNIPANFVPGDYNLFVCVDHPDFDCNTSPFSDPSLTIFPLPSIDITVPEAVCIEDEFLISGELTGTPPFTINYAFDGVSGTQTTTTNSFSFSHSLSEVALFEVLSVTDGNGCTSSINQQFDILLLPNTWTGNAVPDPDWNNPQNWSCGLPPTRNTDVIIPSGLVSNNYPVLNTGEKGAVKNLLIETGTSLEVHSNWLQIYGTIQNSGTYDVQNGSLSFLGDAMQSIPTASFLDDRIKNLTVDNPAGLILDGPLEVTGTVLAANGDIQSSGNLKLISDATQTALIDGSGTGNITGIISMQRYMDVAFGYKYFSSPFQNTTVGDFSGYLDLLDPVTDFPHFYRYNENRQDINGNDATGWEPFITETNTLEVGAGYALNFGDQTDLTVEISGEVNNDPVALALQNTGGEYTTGFHLAGNPYPSPIDWNAPGWEKTNIDNAVYFFTAGSTQYTGSYSSYVNGVSSDARSSSVIPAMQGFFVKVSEPETPGNYPVAGTLIMDNSVRISDFDQQFLKTRKETPKPLLRVTASFVDEKKSDALVVYFPDFAVENFEKDKGALKLMNTDERVPSFYSLTPNTKKLSINALPFLNSKKIPLGISVKKSGRMRIELSTKKSLPPGTEVYLLDLENNNVQSLDEKTSYEFSITAGEHNSRFELLLSDRNLKDPSEALIQPLSVYSKAGILKIQIAVEKDRQGILSISSLNGQVLQTKKVSGDEYLEFGNLPNSGVYIVSLKLADQRYSKKVIIRK